MDSKGRQKAVYKLLELTKDPEVLSIARQTLCSETAKAPAPKMKEKISARDWILYLLTIPVAIILFLARRNPMAAIVGSVFIFASCLPAVLNVAPSLTRKIIYAAGLAILDAAFGFLVFHWLVQERDDEIVKNLRPSAFLLNPANIRTSVFGVINDNSSEIISDEIYCYINEAYSDQPPVEIRLERSEVISEPRPIKRGSDVRLAQCLVGSIENPMTCADVTVPMSYQIPQFPQSRGMVKFRFVMSRVNGQYQWTRVGEATPVGLCSGIQLPDEALKLQ